MNAKLNAIVKSPLANDVKNGVKIAAINMAAALVLNLAFKGVVKVIEVAADAVTKNSQDVA